MRKLLAVFSKGRWKMEQKLQEQLDGLLEKYTELLLGETNDELKEEVKQWILYTHIAKSMPPLANLWECNIN
ncbi:DUF2573 family protein, partial [Bacillus subtilis]|uniref:DUF2573 family protein n=1 Tax=Bacillus subtilis TaxID=1423 RepID=UPI002DC022DF